MTRRLLTIAAMLLLLATPAAAQIVIPYTFTFETVIDQDQVNSNFTTLGNSALNRAGGTLTGNLAVDVGVTIDGLDLSAAVANKASTATIAGVWTFSVTPVFTHITVEGVTTSGSTGTGLMVFGTTPTLTTPVLSGSVTGTYTLAGTPTITSPTISGPTLSGSVVGTYTLAGTPTLSGTFAGTPTFSGALTFSSTATHAADVIFSASQAIRQSTSDAADNRKITVTGGGAADNGTGARGAEIVVEGNESGNPGWMQFFPGNIAGAKARFYSTALSASMFELLNSDGLATFLSSAAEFHILNSTATNGGYATIQKSGVAVGYMGSAKAVPSSSANMGSAELIVRSASVLWLEGASNHVRSESIRDNTTGSAANVFIDSTTGRFSRSTSSARYKDDITRSTDWRWLLNLHQVTFVGKGDEAKLGHAGLLAEEVARFGPRDAAGRPRFAGLDAQGRPDDVAYPHLAAPIIEAIKALVAKDASLERRLRALEGTK